MRDISIVKHIYTYRKSTLLSVYTGGFFIYKKVIYIPKIMGFFGSNVGIISKKIDKRLGTGTYTGPQSEKGEQELESGY